MEIQNLPNELQVELTSSMLITNITQCTLELVFNSIDAKATCIAVRIDLAKFHIQVIDNGTGIKENDLKKIGQQYMTSKSCNSYESTYTWKYYGCRGEFLSSLRNIAKKITIHTQPKGKKKTFSKVFMKGDLGFVNTETSLRPTSGTTIIVEDCLYKIPVRKNQIKKSFELEQLKRELSLIFLMNPNISLSLKDNVSETMILNLNKISNEIKALASFSSSFNTKNIKKIESETKNYRISGYISIEFGKNKNEQLIFINRRFVPKSRIHKLLFILLSHNLPFSKSSESKHKSDIAHVSDINHSDKKQRKFPVYCLNIDCHNSLYDMHFEPPKTRVEFKDWERLYIFITKSINTFLIKENFLVKKIKKPQKSDVLYKKINNNFGLSQLNNAIESKLFKRSEFELERETQNVINKMNELHDFANNSQYFNPTNNCELTDQDKATDLSVPDYAQWLLSNKTLKKMDREQETEDIKKQKKFEEKIKVFRDLIENAGNRTISIFHKTIQEKISGNYENINFDIPNQNVRQDDLEEMFKTPVNKVSFPNVSVHQNFHQKNVKSKLLQNKHLKPLVKTDAECYRRNYEKVTNSKEHKHDVSKKNKTGDKISTSKSNLCENVKSKFQENCWGNIGTSFPKNERKTQFNLFEKNKSKQLEINHDLEEILKHSKYFDNFDFKSFDSESDRIEIQETASYYFEDPKIFKPSKINDESFIVKYKDNIFSTDETHATIGSINKNYNPIGNEIFQPSQFCSTSEIFNYEKSKTRNPGQKNKLTLHKNNENLISNYQATEIKENDNIFTSAKVSNKIHNVTLENNKVVLNTSKSIVDSTTNLHTTSMTPILNCDNSFNEKCFKLTEEIAYLNQSPSIITKSTNTSSEVYFDKNNSEESNNTITNRTEENSTSSCSIGNWISKYDNDGRIIFLNIKNGMTTYSIPEFVRFEANSRIEYLPKGMSQIFVNSRQTSDFSMAKLSMNEKEEFFELIQTETELKHIKWKIRESFPSVSQDPLTSVLKKTNCVTNKKTISFSKVFPKTFFNELNVLGQIDQKFIASLWKENSLNQVTLVLFDQHAVHERIRTENLLRTYKNKSKKFMKIRLNPESIVELSIAEFKLELLQVHAEFVKKFGFEVVFQGKETLQVHSIPTCLYNKQLKQEKRNQMDVLTHFIQRIVDEITEHILQTKGEIDFIPKTILNIIYSEACRGAIKFGDSLSLNECQNLINELSECELPFQCAHGRPTAIPLMDLCLKSRTGRKTHMKKLNLFQTIT